MAAVGMLALAGPTLGLDNPTSSGPVSMVQTNFVRIPQTGDPPEIDGEMSAGEWVDSSAVSAFWYKNIHESTHYDYLAPFQTQLQVYMAYDDQKLYLAFTSPVYPEGSWLRARGRFPDVISHPLYGIYRDDYVAFNIRPHPDEVLSRRLGGFGWFINPISSAGDFGPEATDETGPAGGRKSDSGIRTAAGPEPIEHYNRRAALKLDEAGRFELSGWTSPRLEKYSEIDYAYRYALTIRDAAGDEVYHIHFPVNTTENRPWRADTIPGHGSGESKEVVVDPDGPYPSRWRNLMRRYEDLPDGHKVRVTAKRIFDPSNRVHFDAPQRAVAINEDGEKYGAEHQLNHWATQVLKTIHWKDGVKHGLEKHWATADRNRYARTVIPWENGKVEGVKRTYFPNGQTMVEVRYEDGEPVGKSTTYDRQGRVVRTTEFKDGVRHGERIDYYPPEVKRRIPLEEGQIHGVVHEYDKDGRVIHKTPFRHDLQHGVEKRYNEQGEVVETRHWLNGNHVSEAEYRNR